MERTSVSERVRERLLAEPAIVEVLADIHESRMRVALRDAKREPKKHATTTVWPPGESPRYRYWPTPREANGRRVVFCWTTNRNAAGYFLAFVEITNADGTGRRVKFTAHKKRSAARETMERWRDEHCERLA